MNFQLKMEVFEKKIQFDGSRIKSDFFGEKLLNHNKGLPRDTRFMKMNFFYVAKILILGGVFSTFAQAGEMNLLPNEGFKAFKVGDTLPAKGWIFTGPVRKETTGKFVDDNSFTKGKGPVLEVFVSHSSHSDVQAALMRGIETKEPGMYRASIWIKAGSDVRGISGKPPSARLWLWGSGSTGKLKELRKGEYLKWDFEFHVPDNKIGKHLYRIDIYGRGTFYLAEPSLEKINEAAALKEVSDKLTNKKRESPLKETAHFSFDNSLNEDKLQTSPSISKKVRLVPGFIGQSVTVEDGGALSYQIAKLLKGKSGSVALWIKTSEDPVPFDFPRDPVQIIVSGENELGKKADIFKGDTSSYRGWFSFDWGLGSSRTDAFCPPKNFYGNEWRHFIFTWGKKFGLRLYLDGRPFKVSEVNSGDFRKTVEGLSKSIKLENLRLLTATGNNPHQKAFFDELRLFNREMDKNEALTLYEEYVPAYPVLMDYAVIAGGKKPFRTKIFHKKGAIPAELKVLAENLKGEKLFDETLKVAKTGNYNINFHPAVTGDYRIVFMYGGKRIRTFEVTAVSSKSITSDMPKSVSGNVKTKLIEEIDCAKAYPALRYLDDGEVRVVDSPIGKYRESTSKTFAMGKNQGFAYNFTIKNPGRPHWLEIEYPDDKPRVFFIVVDQKLDNKNAGEKKSTWSFILDTIGVANGINNPVTGKMTKKRLLFWPDAKKCMVGCFGYRTFPGCAGPAMKNIRVYENVDPLPQVTVNTPAGMPQRYIGNWNEDNSMETGCWFNRCFFNQIPNFNYWKDKLKRRVEYIKFTGQNQAVLQVFRSGDITMKQWGQPANHWSAGATPGWDSLAATIFEREKLPFYIQFCDYNGTYKAIGPDKISQNSFEAAAKGMASIEMMTADGTIAHYIPKWKGMTCELNFLCPVVREAFLKTIRFYRDQFDTYGNFKGILFVLGWTNFSFSNEKTGYGDYTIALFEKETGAKIPVKDKGMSRFGKRYNYLKSNKELWNKWLDWRCAKVKEFLLTLTKELNAGKRKGLKIILPLMTEISKISFISDNLGYYPKEVDLKEGFRRMGMDIVSLSREPSLIIEPISAPNYALLYRQKSDKNLDAFWYSDDFAALLQDSKSPAMMLSRHANMEICAFPKPAIKKYWWPRGTYGWYTFHCFSNALPDNKYVPQTLAWGLANGDLWHIDHGWWGNPENGAHKEFQKFYQAYRSIPAVHFKKVAGVNDPVMVRQYNAPDGKSGWFYLVNMQYYKTKVKITFNSDVKLTDAVFNCPQETDGKVLEKELNPYQVICFHSDKSLNITKVEQIVPENIVKELIQIVADLKAGAKRAPSAQAQLLVRTAEKMLKEKRYLALYYLTMSYSAKRLLKEAANSVLLKMSLNPDTNALMFEATNRMLASASVELKLTALPKGLNSPDMTRKIFLRAKDSKALSFALSGLDLKKINCRNELEFDFECQVNGGKVRKVKYVFRPIIGTKVSNIKIDGNLSDWNGARWNKLVKDTTVTWNALIPAGPFDSEFAVKWNEQGLYLAIRVNERDFIPTPKSSSHHAWLYDFVEIGIDQKNNAIGGSCEKDKDDFVLYFANMENKPPSLALVPADGQTKHMVSKCRIERRRAGSLSTYEIFIPATVLNQAKFKPDANIGFYLKLHNREHTKAPNGRDSWGYSISTNEYPCDNPGFWNSILLSKKAE